MAYTPLHFRVRVVWVALQGWALSVSNYNWYEIICVNIALMFGLYFILLSAQSVQNMRLAWNMSGLTLTLKRIKRLRQRASFMETCRSSLLFVSCGLHGAWLAECHIHFAVRMIITTRRLYIHNSRSYRSSLLGPWEIKLSKNITMLFDIIWSA